MSRQMSDELRTGSRERKTARKVRRSDDGDGNGERVGLQVGRATASVMEETTQVEDGDGEAAQATSTANLSSLHSFQPGPSPPQPTAAPLLAGARR
jgi:hypothetical protein